MGVDFVWSAEAWGMDTIVPLAYLAAKTENIKLGTGIMQISARVPSMIAMTAQSLDTVSKGRFILGLGVSGPQVVEGLHGASFAKPLGRLRETVEILRIALSGEKVAYEGEHYVLPRPGGEGKALEIMKNHMRSQMDWRSYFTHRMDVQRRARLSGKKLREAPKNFFIKCSKSQMS